jgi:hypothetical protein
VKPSISPLRLVNRTPIYTKYGTLITTPQNRHTLNPHHLIYSRGELLHSNLQEILPFCSASVPRQIFSPAYMAPPTSFIASLLDSIENSPPVGSSSISRGPSMSSAASPSPTSRPSRHGCEGTKEPHCSWNRPSQNLQLILRHSTLVSKMTKPQSEKSLDHLASLPTELLQLIGGLLPYFSEAALALCSKSIMSELGDKVLKRVNGPAPEVFAWNSRKGMSLECKPSKKQDDRLELLELLQKDCRMKLCPFCKTLHKYEPRVLWASDVEKSQYSNRGAALAYGLPFAFIQLSLKGWFQYNYSVGRVDSYLQAWRITQGTGDAYYERNFGGYIVDGWFYLRTEYLMGLPMKPISEPPPTFQNIKLCSITHVGYGGFQLFPIPACFRSLQTCS